MPRQLRKSEKCILILLLVLSAAAAVSKIWVGFDIDEGYAISMPQRLVNGDHLFRDMWEVHQTSSFLPALFLWVFEKITGGTEGVAIYLRIVATVLHLLMTGVFLRTLSKLEVRWRCMLCLVYFNFLPKWIISLDFSMQQIWGITLVIYLLRRMADTNKMRYCFGTGLALAFTVLAYPGMVVLYPVVLLCCILLPLDVQGIEKEKVKSKINKLAINKCMMVTLGCAFPALLFFIYVLSHMSLQDLLQSIPLVFMDGTHQFTASAKLMAYGRQWANVCKQITILATPAFLITIVIKVLRKRAMHGIRQDREFVERNVITFLLIWMLETSLLVILANVVGIQMGPFHFQVRYLGFFLGTCVLAFLYRKKYPHLFWHIFVLHVVAFAGILLFSNVGPDSSSSYLVLGVIGGFILLHELINGADSVATDGKEKEAEIVAAHGRERMDHLLWLCCAVFVLSLIFCKGYYVRITEYGPSNILEHREQMTMGPLKGLYLLPKDHARCTSDYETIGDLTKDGQKLLFLGTEGIENLASGGGFVSPSTISTPAFNEQWTLYFTMYPDKIPDVIVIAKNTVDDREKFLTKNPFGIWISENYDTMHMDETDFLCIIRK